MTLTQAQPSPSTSSPVEGEAGTDDLCASVDRPFPRSTGQDRYTISEVAQHTGLSVHTLRWYERIGLMPHVDRSHTGQRRYRNTDLEWLAFVGKLRLTGMAVADMVRYADLMREGDHTFPERQALLLATRENVLRRIAELQGTLSVLDYKIDFYGEAAAAVEAAR
ncbi:MerR family transcriptional regulator [Streptomyces sp. 3MP-14]|uniref:MerR family transcriptional regulator n=1 Tax=Streptomyces mimosae TaxID=2586635 RepID=A0A5N6AQF4_9ACTN|nr:MULTISPECIES: MerR family transcriptional regulator [Streptomyces]KAB8170844.1 MerR family transcriptional regulator [Streptomyces mimosae]KAB8179804.1 MerR family transcriptional regulator [Streptomyces sp. 3MP-14]